MRTRRRPSRRRRRRARTSERANFCHGAGRISSRPASSSCRVLARGDPESARLHDRQVSSGRDPLRFSRMTPHLLKSFRGLQPRATFSCLSKRKVAKENDTPFPRPADVLSAGFVCGGWAFRQHILCWRKGECVPALAPAGLVIHYPPLHRGPEKASARPARLKSVRLSARNTRGHDVRRSFGAPVERQRLAAGSVPVRSTGNAPCPKGRRQGCRRVFRAHTTCARKTPQAGADFAGRTPAKRARGVLFSLVRFS